MALLTEKRVKKTSAPAADSSAGESDSEAAQSSGNEAEGNAGWADSILKVLKTTKPETQNKTVLARAKNSQAAVRFQKAAASKKPGFDFEIEKTEVKDEDDESDDEDEDSSGKKKSEWSVLREDFMTNKKIKHWDEEDDDEEGNNDEADDSDDDDEGDD